jgi:hypothetical protein
MKRVYNILGIPIRSITRPQARNPPRCTLLQRVAMLGRPFADFHSEHDRFIHLFLTEGGGW